MSDIINLGDVANQESPESGERIRDGAERLTVIKAGLRAAIEAIQPDIGDKEFLDGYAVERSIVKPRRGGQAELTVSLVKISVNLDPENPGDPVEVQPLTTFWEVDWRSIDKPLSASKMLEPTSQTFQTAIDAIEAWRNAPAQRKRKYMIPLSTLTREADPLVDADWEAMPGDAKKICEKIAAGVEAWLCFSPVITKTSILADRAETGGCGVIGDPDTKVAGYEYLKTGDNIVQQADRSWRRTETWQGAEKWDADIYGDT